MLTPIKAIRAKCLDCCCDQIKEVKECGIVDCSLHPYRLGKRPVDSSKPKRELTEEEKEIRAERMRKIHDARKNKINS